MTVTVITEGPIDKLNKGILAGQQLISTFVQLKSLKAGNELREKRFQLDKVNAHFTQQALSASTEANIVRTSLDEAKLKGFVEEHKATLAALQTGTMADRLVAQQKLADALVDVSNENLTLEQTIAIAGTIMEQTNTLPTPVNALGIGMIVKGAHSQALSDIELEEGRMAAHAISSQTGQINAMPAEFRAILGASQSKIKGLNDELILSARMRSRLNIPLDQAAKKTREDMRQQIKDEQQFMLDLSAAWRQGFSPSSTGTGASTNLPTITADAAGQAAYQALAPGAQFIDPNGKTQTKPPR